MDESFHYLGDPHRSRQVVTNLVANAIKYTEHGEVWMEALLLDGVPTVSVRDTGPGIAEKDVDEIFQRFRQTREGRAKADGVGLGLSISRELALLMGGEIQCHSSPGEGSVFTFRLPLESTEAVAVQAP